jgi:hypothetical protein
VTGVSLENNEAESDGRAGCEGLAELIDGLNDGCSVGGGGLKDG